MATKVTFDSILLEYKEEDNYIHLVYLKPSESDEFRAAWNKALDLAIQYQCNKWLLDQKKQVIRPDDQEWVQSEWFPLSVEKVPFSPQNPRYVALIESDNFFVQFSTAKFVRENSIPGFEVIPFRNQSAARKWLIEC